MDIESRAYEEESIEPFEEYIEDYDDTYNDIEYNFPLSTIAGALVAYVMVLYCFDIAVRAVKLSFFEVLAPFPILISIIPKQDKIFKNWLKASLKTFFEIFLRVFLLNLCVYLISKVPEVLDAMKLKGNMLSFTNAFLILGLVIFLRKAPKLLSDIFGFDLKNTSLSLRDRLRDSGITALAGGALGTAAFWTSTATALHDRKDLNKVQRIGRWMRQGLVQGITRGGKVGFQEGWHEGTLQGMGASSNYAIHTQKAYARGANWFQVQGELFRDDLGFMSYYDRKKAAIEIGRDSEKMVRDREIRRANKEYLDFSNEQERKYSFNDKIKAYEKTLEKEKAMEDKAKDQSEKITSKTTTSIKRLTDQVETKTFSPSGGLLNASGEKRAAYGTASIMNSDQINSQIAMVNSAYNSGSIDQRQRDEYLNYYNGQKAKIGIMSTTTSLANKNDIEKEIQIVNDLFAAGSIGVDQQREYIKYYELRKKDLAKQNLTDAILYNSSFAGKSYEEADSMFGNGVSDITDANLKGYASKYCYESYVEDCKKNGVKPDKDSDSFRYQTFAEMKDGFLSTIFSDGQADRGRINNLTDLYNAYDEYKVFATNDNLKVFERNSDGNIYDDGRAKVAKIEGVENMFGENVFKGKDHLTSNKLEIQHEKVKTYSKRVSFDVDSSLKSKYGEISDYNELLRYKQSLEDEVKSVNDKYSSELDYLKFLEPSREASENIKKFRKKYRGKHGGSK